LLAPALAATPAYHGYSYERSADVFRRDVSTKEAAELEAEVERLAPRALRRSLRGLSAARRALFLCPRQKVSGKRTP
jgi:hypothetical protein